MNNAQRRRAAKEASRTGLPVAVADVPGWERRSATADEDHRFRVEVTIAACIQKPDGHALGNNVVDGTLGFLLAAMPRPPRELTDAEVNQTLTHNMSPLFAAIQSVLTSMGLVFIGTIDEPISEHSTPTGELGKSSPVRVQVELVDSDQPKGRVQ